MMEGRTGAAMVPFFHHTGYDAKVIGKLKFVGLTGGIGTGKSTVAQMIRAAGIPVLDADVLARQVVEPGQPAHAAIAAAWPDVIGPDGAIDRKKLGARVFNDPAARLQLEAITHPRIQERAEAEARRLEAAGHRLAFYEASLLVESNRHRGFDGLVVVTASEEQQLARAMARDGSTREQALARLRAQMPAEEKRRAATHLIDNSGDLASTQRQVDQLIAAFGGP
jgi:dephospho-CoA kinase